jgi:outer membrane protein OmpA-like peptidoglycan-associated protein
LKERKRFEEEIGELERLFTIGDYLISKDYDDPRDDPNQKGQNTGRIEFPSGEFLNIIKGAVGLYEEDYDPNNSGNPLLDTSGNNRNKRLSKHFTVEELTKFGEKKFLKSRIDTDMILRLERIREFIKKPIVIVKGYYSYKYLSNLFKKKLSNNEIRIQDKPHLGGLGVKFIVKGMSGIEIAKSILFSTNSYLLSNDKKMKIDIDDYAATFYVKQHDLAPTCSIKNGQRRDKTIAIFRQYWWLYTDIPTELIEKIRVKVLEPPIEEFMKDFVHYAIYQKSIRNEEIITDVLFYVLQYNQAYLDNEDSVTILDKNNKYVFPYWKNIRDNFVKPALSKTSIPDEQKGGQPETSKTGPIEADAKPENIKIDISGRYESYQGDKSFFGATLMINQAGKHIEAVLSPVFRPGEDATFERVSLRYSGDWNDKERSFILIDKKQRSTKSGDALHFKLLQRDSITLEMIGIGKNQKPKVEKYVRYSAVPVLMEPIVDNLKFGIPLRELQWQPLLTRQISHINMFFKNIPKLKSYLEKFYNQSFNFNKTPKQVQYDAAGEFFRAINEHLKKSNYGIHRSDHLISAFYLRALLSSTSLQLNLEQGNIQSSILFWLERMVSILETNRIQPAFLDSVKFYLGIDPGIGRQNIYRFKFNFKGGGPKNWGFGLLIFYGSVTIEKISEKKWENSLAPNGKVTYNCYIVMVSSGTDELDPRNSLDLDMREYEIEGKTNIEWLPTDFTGNMSLGFVDLSAEFGGVIEGTISHVVMTIYGNGLHKPIDLNFSDAGFDPKISGHPKRDRYGKKDKDSRPDLGIKLGQGWIGKGNLPVNAIIPSEKVKTDYMTNYESTKTVFFKFDSAILTDSARQALRVMCAHELPAFMNPFSKLKIVGYTDSKGKVDYNEKLSIYRATNTLKAIKEILTNTVSRTNFAISNPVAIGEGELDAKDKDKDEYRNLDRRKVIIFLNGRVVLRL